MAVWGYIAKLKKEMGLGFGDTCKVFSEEVPYLIFFQWTKFQCHILFPSQDIK